MQLYELAGVFQHYFFAPRDEVQETLPQPLVAVGALRHDVLGAYRLVPNANGLPYEIILNERWIDRPDWEIAETLLHEMVHLFQEGVLKTGARPPYHNQAFVQVAEEIGIHPKLGEGYHLRPADGQFARLMARLGIERPDHVKTAGADFVLPPGAKSWWDDDRKKTGKAKGTSTLRLYVCECEPPHRIRVGEKNLAALCLECRGIFKPRP